MATRQSNEIYADVMLNLCTHTEKPEDRRHAPQNYMYEFGVSPEAARVMMLADAYAAVGEWRRAMRNPYLACFAMKFRSSELNCLFN